MRPNPAVKTVMLIFALFCAGSTAAAAVPLSQAGLAVTVRGDRPELHEQIAESMQELLSQTLGQHQTADAGPATGPETDNRFTVDVKILQLDTQAVAMVQSSLHMPVQTAGGTIEAIVWQSPAQMFGTPADTLVHRCREKLTEQLVLFENTYTWAQPAAQVNQPYIASKNSQVFHLGQCSSARRISDENLVGFESLEQAQNSGRRPCRICQPGN